MFRWLGELFMRLAGQRAPSEEDYGPHDAHPAATAAIKDRDDGPQASAGSWESEEAKPEYERFCASFCFKPGMKLMDYLEAEGITQLQTWLHWDNEEAEPKAFIRLMLVLMEQGENIWDQPGLTLYLDGRWSQGGGPSPASSEALAILSRVLEKPIELMFERKPGAPFTLLLYEP